MGLSAPGPQAAEGLSLPVARVLPAGSRSELAPSLSRCVKVLLPHPQRGTASVKQPGLVLSLYVQGERREECGSKLTLFRLRLL